MKNLYPVPAFIHRRNNKRVDFCRMRLFFKLYLICANTLKNKLSRKDFLKLTAALALSLPMAGVTASNLSKKSGNTEKNSNSSETGFKYIDSLGIQLFMILEILEKDPQSVFRTVAGTGIKNVEFFNPATLNQYVPVAKDQGLTPISTHFMPGYISGNWDEARKMGFAPPDNYAIENIIEDCKKNGIGHMGIAIMMPEDRKTMDDFRKFAELANKAGEKCKQSGLQLYYHNHSFEFKPDNGKIPFEEMLKIFDPELVKNELDVFWVTISGNDAVKWINRLGNRLIYLHLKDLVKDTPKDFSVFNVDPKAFTELGSGIIDFRPILTTAKSNGIRFAFLDQDNTQMDKIESIRKSMTYLKNLDL